MADKKEGNKKKKKSVASGFGQFLVNCFLGANVVTLVLLWGCCASTWVNPAYHPNVGVIGLAFPVFLLLNLLFIPFWIIFKFRMALVPVVGISLCGGYVLDYCPVHFGKPSDDATFVVISWNTYNMGHTFENCDKGLDYLKRIGADAVFMQEMAHSPEYRHFSEVLTNAGYHINYSDSRVFASRHPILSAKRIDAASYATNSIDVYELLVGEDTLTMFNGHLECNRLTHEEKRNYKDVLRLPESEKIKGEARFLTGRLARSAAFRARQTQAFIAYLDSVPKGRPMIFCGDFNDTPISYAYQQVNKHLESAYRNRGMGVGLTYREKSFPIRIDHVFYSPEWECCEALIDHSIEISDHYPVVVKFKKRQN